MKHLIATLILLGGMATPALAYRRADYTCRLPLGEPYGKYHRCLKHSFMMIRNTDSTSNITYSIEGRTRMLRPGQGVLVFLKAAGPTTVIIDGEKTVKVNPDTHNLSFWRYDIGGEIGHRLVPRSQSLIEK